LKFGEKAGLKVGMATNYGGLGSIELKRERWSEAREWFEKELPLVRELGRQDLIAAVQFGLARVYEEEGRPDLALPLAQEALAIDERLHHAGLPETRELVERLKKKIGEQ
jgi:tetratricopeptide (TPR) repeat protein